MTVCNKLEKVIKNNRFENSTTKEYVFSQSYQNSKGGYTIICFVRDEAEFVKLFFDEDMNLQSCEIINKLASEFIEDTIIPTYYDHIQQDAIRYSIKKYNKMQKLPPRFRRFLK